jgi:hypothetical protein
MFKHVVIIIKFGVAYQTCLEFRDDRALKISAIVHFLFESYAISNPILAAVQTARQGLGMGVFEQLNVGIISCVEYQSCAEFVMTALTRIQHFCIKVERTTEFSVSVGLLPSQLSSFLQFAFFGHAKWEFAAVSNDNFEAYEILYLLTKLEIISVTRLLDVKYSMTMLLPFSSECTNELLSCMFYTCHFFLSKIMAICLIKARISDGGTHAQLSQRFWSIR